jgi:hypothetical protein
MYSQFVLEVCGEKQVHYIQGSIGKFPDKVKKEMLA